MVSSFFRICASSASEFGRIPCLDGAFFQVTTPRSIATYHSNWLKSIARIEFAALSPQLTQS